MNEKSVISSIIVALNTHKGSVLSTKPSSREVEGGVKYHAPGVIGVEISVWDQYGKKRCVKQVHVFSARTLGLAAASSIAGNGFTKAIGHQI